MARSVVWLKQLIRISSHGPVAKNVLVFKKQKNKYMC